MDRKEEVRDILYKIQAEDPESFARFSSEHSICFKEANGDWLFPALYEFYTKEINNPIIVELLQKIGMLFHNESMKEPFAEIITLDRSLCLDESIIFEYIDKQQKHTSKKIKNHESLKTPYKTKKRFFSSVRSRQLTIIVSWLNTEVSLIHIFWQISQVF